MEHDPITEELTPVVYAVLEVESVAEALAKAATEAYNARNGELFEARIRDILVEHALLQTVITDLVKAM